MNSTEIKSILKSPYNRENWKNLYRNIFHNKVTFHEEPYQYNVNEDIVESLFQIGYATLDDEYIVALFEVNIKSDVNLLSKKIGLRKIISKYISDDKFNGVLTIFENGSPDYRFTFASKTTKITEEGIEVVETESKRFTYILGENEPCLTPTQRFESLFRKNGNINLEDIKDAFSVEKLNKEFFNGYKEHYELLCNYFYSIPLKKKFFNDDDKLIRDFVKKFLGRIVFLYFVQKKGWLGVKNGENWGSGDHLFLSNLYKSYNKKNKFYSEVISKIFFEYLSIERENDLVTLFDDKVYRIPYLNGGLFEKENIDEYEINFEESYLESLFSFFDRFNFTIYEDDPNEHTVAVDPEMLGHIFENLLEDNKDKGAFYTPKEIVHYMCQESLIEYLTTWFENKGYDIIGYSSFDKPEKLVLFSENEARKGQLVLENKLNNESKKIDRFLIENLLKKRLSDSDKNLILVHSVEFHEALDKVKICDPAIGSGAFPMGLLQEIFISKQTLWNFEHDNLDNFPASEIKLNIIQNSIYGVDIEKGAVDIARLRFWLSLIVEESKPNPLPNLDYKIITGDSLLPKLNDELLDIEWDIKSNVVGKVKDIILDQQTKLYSLNHLQHLFFLTYGDKHKIKNKIKDTEISILINQLTLHKINFIEKKPIQGGFSPTEKEEKQNEENNNYIKSIDNNIQHLDRIKNSENLNLEYFNWKLNFPEVLNEKIIHNNGFDIVIANPPYVSTKGVNEKNKSLLKTKYGFSDDLYYHFIELGIDLLKEDGILTMITPDTYFTTLSKKLLRNKILTKSICSVSQLGHDVFESAMVSTAVIVLKNTTSNGENIVKISDVRGMKYLSESLDYVIKQIEYKNSINGAFFIPNENNLKINSLLSNLHQKLNKQFWEKIISSKEITRNKIELNTYRNSLKEGDWTLIGLVTEGGQGLATGNNGRYVAALVGSKEANRITTARYKKLNELNKKYKTSYKLPENEFEICKLFEDLKSKYGNNCFGQGFIYKIIEANNVVELNLLTKSEKSNGILDSNKSFVPYDKGDKEGNRWFYETSFYIDWSKESVDILKKDSAARFQGYNFFFKNGLCWNNNLNENYSSIKCRINSAGVFDVASMTVCSVTEKIPEYYLISLINSKTVGDIYRNFINNTVNVQINDIRNIPIKIPKTSELSECKALFDMAVIVQKQYFNNKINNIERETKLSNIENEMNILTKTIYGLV
jgi:hypothetical protein